MLTEAGRWTEIKRFLLFEVHVITMYMLYMHGTSANQSFEWFQIIHVIIFQKTRMIQFSDSYCQMIMISLFHHSKTVQNVVFPDEDKFSAFMKDWCALNYHRLSCIYIISLCRRNSCADECLLWATRLFEMIKLS